MQEMLETQVQSLDQEDPLVEEMTTCSIFLAWKVLWTVCQSTVHGVTKSWTQLSTHNKSTYQGSLRELIYVKLLKLLSLKKTFMRES